MSSGPYTSEKGCKIGLDRVAAALEVCPHPRVTGSIVISYHLLDHAWSKIGDGNSD